MIDLTDKQSIYDNITKAKENKEKFELAGTIHRLIKKGIDNTRKETKEECLNLSANNLSDSELRVRVKGLLIKRLADGTLSASDIGQLKDIFGLASKTDDLSIEVVDYSNALIDCPHCKKNVHQTSTK
jgi:hypothetical protein|tara:strand:- start:216 stop:599 length:384 start_codon:yes stop_codon:yes gene_type:complete